MWKLEGGVSHETLVLRLQHVLSRFSGFLLPSPSLWRKLQKLSFSKASKQVVMSFCVVGMVLPDVLTCLQACRQSFCVTGAILLHRFQTMSLHFLWQTQRFRELHRHFAWQALHFRRVVLHVIWASHCQGCVKCTVALHTQHVTLHNFHFTLHTLHSTLYTLHSALHTVHFIYTPHSTLYTPHSTLCTPHCALYTLHFTLRT